jgi:predicted ribosome quality control (RQC) complex YloA/Tae2 family protein
MRDLFEHKKAVSLKDVALLKVGRHFRFGKNKIIVGRNESENKILLQIKEEEDYYFEVQGCGSPVTLLQGLKTKRAIEEAARLTAYHSDQKTERVRVRFGKKDENRLSKVSVPSLNEVDQLRVTTKHAPERG